MSSSRGRKESDAPMTPLGQSDSEKPPLVEVERALSVILNLDEHCETAGTYDGINFTPDGGESYIVTPAHLREIAEALSDVAAEREAEEGKR